MDNQCDEKNANHYISPGHAQNDASLEGRLFDTDTAYFPPERIIKLVEQS